MKTKRSNFLGRNRLAPQTLRIRDGFTLVEEKKPMVRRLRWWWRVLVSVVAGLTILLVWGSATPLVVDSTRVPNWILIANMVCAVVVSEAVSLAIYHKLTYERFLHVGETRCRSCAYILRGLSEPRCPECGERI